MFDPTMTARKLRAAAQKGSTKGSVDISDMNDDHAFPISPETQRSDRSGRSQGPDAPAHAASKARGGSRTTRALLGSCNAAAQPPLPGSLSTSSSFSSTSTTSSSDLPRVFEVDTNQGLSRSTSLVVRHPCVVIVCSVATAAV
jgi:hypothetical protein